jgi:hypothetical protein
MAEHYTSLGKIRENGSLAAMEKNPRQTLSNSVIAEYRGFENNFLREGVKDVEMSYNMTLK